ncbi:GNAT family N-acetyltransferase [Marivirga sp.]|uniref:GNAT family N-acetyltransferase n=1 Tax=Marivirga sp. TaxID=2018662 RepID=UPI003DA6DEB6
MSSSYFELQPKNLNNDLIRLVPLKNSDFEFLYSVASDPDIWAQHPNRNRFERAVFQNFFKGAMESGGAFLIQGQNKEAIGSSRFYDFNSKESAVHIGYTFLAKKYWGKGYNRALKSLMLNHAFKYVDKVIFHVGSNNIPSQKAMNKLGAIKTGEIEVAYYGEPIRKNFIYEIIKKEWDNIIDIT